MGCLDPRAPEHEIAAVARHNASRVRTMLYSLDRRKGMPACMPSSALASKLDYLAAECQARPVAAHIGLSGRIARMVDAQWWHRNMRRELCRQNEVIEHAAGRIRKREQCYVSDHAVRTKARRAKANRAILEGLEVVNEQGHALNLAEVADASVSNPRLRRSELMVRCRGFEEMAAAVGHEAVFLTLTCPSRFHRFSASGETNPVWEMAGRPTARDGQTYLCRVWVRIRAEWKRQGIAPYGFRVAEPHHDGCPHWHILLFAPAHQVGWFQARRFVADREDHGTGLVGVAGAYALADSPGEPGAAKHRFTCVRIDTSKGSATGYIAKYIAKNIDGEKEDGSDVGLDFASGTRAVEAAQRVRAWASTHGIRQFQQIGGPSVTVWRELRRLKRGAEHPVLQLDLIEGPRSAADRGMWALFWFHQGGPEVSRDALSLRPMYDEAGQGKYGDTVTRVRGVLGVYAGEVHRQITRMHTWTVQTAGQAVSDATQAEWTEVLRIRHFEKRSGKAASTWTGVNNCTAKNEACTTAADTQNPFVALKHQPPGIEGLLAASPFRPLPPKEPDC